MYSGYFSVGMVMSVTLKGNAGRFTGTLIGWELNGFIQVKLHTTCVQLLEVKTGDICVCRFLGDLA